MRARDSLEFAYTSARAHLRYRANLLGYVLVTGVSYLVRFVFLDRVTELGGDSIGGWSQERIVDFYFAGVLLGLLSWAFAGSANEFFRHVHLGRIEPFLVRPVGLGTLILSRWVNSANLLMAGVMIVVVAIDRSARFGAAGVLGIAGYAVSIVLGVCAVLAMVVLFHSLTFVLQREIPVDYVLNEQFRFAQVPTSAFRGWGVLAVALAPPIVLGVWAPVAALEGDFLALGLLALLVVALGATALGCLRAAIGRFDGLGG